MDALLFSFLVAGFLAVVLLVEGGWLLWSSHRGAEARRIQGRLRVLAAGGRPSLDTQLLREDLFSQLPRAYRVLFGMQRLQALDRFLLQSGLPTTVPAFLAATALGALAGFAGGVAADVFLPLAWWATPAAVLAAASVPALRVLLARRARLQAIEAQLPDMLDLMGRAMRAGHSFPSAVQTAGTEGPEPIAGEFRATFDEVNYGVPMQDALNNLAVRVPVGDLRFFVIAVGIQRETGGNLTELLDKLARLIRERFHLLGSIRVLSAEGRLSAWILSVMPFAMVGLINLINPKFLSLLWTDPAGLKAVQGSLVLMVAGILWMWQLVRIRV